MTSIWTTTYAVAVIINNVPGDHPAVDALLGAPDLWSSSTMEDALTKFDAIQLAYADPGPDYPTYSEPYFIWGAGSANLPTGVTPSVYRSTPELVTLSEDPPAYILSIYKFKANVVNSFTEVTGVSPNAPPYWYYVFEIDSSYSNPTESEYNTASTGDPYDPDINYLFVPMIVYGHGASVNWGDYNVRGNNTTGFFPTAYLSVPQVAGTASFQLAWDDDGRWYPNDDPVDTDTPLKYFPNVSVVNVDFADGARHAVIHPSKDGGFVIYETDATYLIPLGLARVFRNDRTLSNIIDVNLLSSYLPRV